MKNIITLDKIKETILKQLPLIASNQKQVLGFINSDNEIYPTGLDSKIIGRLFEVVSQPILLKVAEQLNLELHTSLQQTLYPDFWLSYPGSPDNNRIAIDIKSTYRKKNSNGEFTNKYMFTLGSYTSFLRNGTKNICGSYSMYTYHLILGFIYSRNDNIKPDIVPISDKDRISPSVFNIQSFIAEKYKISGEKPGSGNTANIGSINSNLKNFSSENGPFSFLGNDTFEDYWGHYPTPSERANKNSLYTDIQGYINWIKAKDPKKAEQLQKKYNAYLSHN